MLRSGLIYSFCKSIIFIRGKSIAGLMGGFIMQAILLFYFGVMHSQAGETLLQAYNATLVAIDAKEMGALLEIRDALRVQKYVWPNNTNACTLWIGISCTKGHVVSIVLPTVRSQVVKESAGSVDLDTAVQALRKLSYLRSITASGFPLLGVLPASLGELTNLRLLNLASTSLHGTLPASLGNLTGLKFLSLSDNHFTGSVSPGVDALCNLKYLNLSLNSFSGALPSTLMACSFQLISMDLSHNKFEGNIPLSIGLLVNLHRLALGNNLLKGSLPFQHLNWTQLEYLDASNNQLCGSISSAVSHMKMLSYLNLEGNQLTGPIPSTISDCTRLQVLLLSNNMLNQVLPLTLSMLTNLQTLSLSFNNLTGYLPSGIFTMPNLTSLLLSHNVFYGPLQLADQCLNKIQNFDISYNFLLGDIPGRFSTESIAKNCFHEAPKQHTLKACWLFYNRNGLSWHDLLPNSIALNGSTVPSPRMKRKLHKNEHLLISLGCATGGAFLLALAGACILCREKYTDDKESGFRVQTGEAELERATNSDRGLRINGNSFLGKAFSLDAIYYATSGFSSSQLVAHGQSGEFYKGTLDDGTTIVVKRIHTAKMRELYLKEIEVFKRASHTRLVTLLGHCTDVPDERFLVYKYMPLGDLASILQTKGHHDEANDCSRHFPLDWITRLRIAIGVAEGLVYLHHECSPPIVHRNIKASSVLLDEQFEVKLTSLGSAYVDDKDQHPRLISCLLGLSQSLDQADQDADALGCSKDIYDFGKLLLGLMSGRCAITDKHDSQAESWVDWAVSLIDIRNKEAIYRLLDPTLVVEGDFLDEVMTMAFIAKACLNPRLSKRPSMVHVLKGLENPQMFFQEEKTLVKLSQTSFQHPWNLFGSFRPTGTASSISVTENSRRSVSKAGPSTYLVQNVSYINEITEISDCEEDYRFSHG